MSGRDENKIVRRADAKSDGVAWTSVKIIIEDMRQENITCGRVVTGLGGAG